MNHLYFLPLCCLISLVTFSTFSQNSVKGSVLFPNQEGVAYANVVLMETDSTTVYKGAVTDEQGDYLFENILTKEYVLIVSFVGFENFIKRISVSGNSTLNPIV